MKSNEWRKSFSLKILRPCEKGVYKILHINEKMNWKQYLISVLIFSGFGLPPLFLLLVLQGKLFANPQNIDVMNWYLSLNTAISFITNTNWQASSWEAQLS